MNNTRTLPPETGLSEKPEEGFRYSIIPCRPVESDAALVMLWRNDPVTLAMSYNQEPKVWVRFWPEFRDDFFADPELPPLFVLRDGKHAAFLRFKSAYPIPALSLDVPGEIVDISINVAPDLRGTGIGRKAISLGSRYLCQTTGRTHILAEIKVGNEASRRAFLAAGYRTIDTVDKTPPTSGQPERIHRLLYTA